MTPTWFRSSLGDQRSKCHKQTYNGLGLWTNVETSLDLIEFAEDSIMRVCWVGVPWKLWWWWWWWWWNEREEVSWLVGGCYIIRERYKRTVLTI
jgi:hypothetical protein